MEAIPSEKFGWWRSFFEVIVIVVTLYCVWFIYPQQTRTVLSQAYQHFSPCSAPVTYRIGTIDPRFNLTQIQVQALLEDDANKWNTAAGKSVLLYDQSNGIVTVNFIYDYRQKATNQLNKISTSVGSSVTQYNAINTEYTSKKNQYLSDKEAYESMLASFQNKQNAYNQEVQQWNARGGAPGGTYNELQQEKAQLQVQSSGLQAQKYNTIGATTGNEFEEGLFQSSFANEMINIYEYASTLRLNRVITHEFGHALGLEHVTDVQAIMNALNSASTESLTAADITELNAACHL
jgi:predicted Zn-dependent protease